MYQQHPNHPVFGKSQSVRRLRDGASIPFDPANTDYQDFKQSIKEGAELHDVDGVPMPAEAVAEFLEQLL